MRVSGVNLGILKHFRYGVAFKPDFSTLPIMDISKRHVVINNNGATVSSNALFLNNPSGSVLMQYISTELSFDFDWDADFNIYFIVKPLDRSARGQQYFLRIVDSGTIMSPYALALRTNSTGTWGISMSTPTNFNDDSLSSYTDGQSYSFAIVKRGSSLKVFIDNSKIFEVVSAPARIRRRLLIGDQNNSLYGTISSLEFRRVAKAVSLDFNTFPFTDAMGGLITNSGVTQNANRAFFNNPSNTTLVQMHLYMSGAPRDLNLQSDFEISFELTLITFAGKTDHTIFTIGNYTSPNYVQCYINASGRMYWIVAGAIATSNVGLVVAGTAITFRLIKKGTTTQIFADNILRGSSGVAPSTLPNETRTLVLGAVLNISGYGMYGYLDNFDVRLF